MAHFAEMRSDNNEILRVVVISNNDVDNNGGELSDQAATWVSNNIAEDEIIKEELGGTYPSTYWKQSSYNHNFRGRFSFVGGTYDSVNDVFVEVKPYPSWILASDHFTWEAPIANPDPNKTEYNPAWNDDLGRWEGTKLTDPHPKPLYYHDGSNWILS